MKFLTVILTLACAVTAIAAPAKQGKAAGSYSRKPKTLSVAPGLKKMAQLRRVCVRREVVGDNIIYYYERGGKPDTVMPAVETNKLKQIVGVKQNSPIQNELVSTREKWRAAVSNYTSEVTRSQAWSNRVVIAEAIAGKARSRIQEQISDLREDIAKYEEYKKSNPLLGGIWNALIQSAERRIAILEAWDK